MSADWPRVKLGEILEITSSKRVKRADYVDLGVPFFRSKEVIELSKGNEISTELFITEKHFKTIENKFGAPVEGDILLTSVGTLGIPYQVSSTDRFYFKDGNLTWFRNFKKGVVPEFIYYWLTSPVAKRKFDEVTIGSTQKALTIMALKSIDIDLPPVSNQKSIVSVLNSIDGKLINNRQTNQTLEHIAQAIFKCWFVDFEPTRAKIIAKEKGANTAIQELAAQAIICGAITLERLEAITQNLETTLQQAINEKLSQANQTPINTEQLKTIAALFPNELVESDGVTNSSGTNLHERSEPEGGGSGTSRLIPEGWHWSEIGDEVVVAGGGTPSTKKEEFWEGGHIHWTSPKDMSNLTDKILLETSRKITDVGLAKISSGLLPENTVLMSSRAPVGYLAITKIPVAINQGYIAMKCEGTLSPEYIVQWAESSMDDIKQRASGTTFAEISKKTFKIIPVVVPSKEAINAYTLVVAKLYSKITESLIEIKSLIEIRDSLLPKLLSGELNVSSD